MLWCGAHAAAASEDSFGKHAAIPSPAVAARNLAVVQVQGEPAPGGFITDFHVPQGVLPVAGQPLIADNGTARLLAMNVDSSVLGAMRDGVAVTFSVGDLGGLNLNLYKRRNAKTAGQQFDLNPAADDSPQQHFWSLGGSLDLVRNNDGHREIVFVPQLLLDFDALTGAHSQFQAFLQYATWKPAPGQAATDQRMPQVAVKLRF
jgi:hypothetical protein